MNLTNGRFVKREPDPLLKRKLSKLKNRVLARLTPGGAYRFLVRDWSGYSDIELVRGMLSAESFRGTMKPVPLPLAEMDSLLVLAPHQDDELVGAGGACVLARSGGASLNVAYLTDGAQTGIGRQFGEPMEPGDVAALREREARAVCERLGARYECLGISNLTMDPASEHVARLRACIEDAAPDVILVPWLLDGAAKHRVANHLLWLALDGARLSKCEIWGYQVNNSVWANGYVDITSAIDEKRALLQIYKSQNDNIRRYDHLADGLAAWNSRVLPSKAVDSAPRFVELFCALPVKTHLALIEKFYFTDFKRTYLGKTQIAANMERLHREMTA